MREEGLELERDRRYGGLSHKYWVAPGISVEPFSFYYSYG